MPKTCCRPMEKNPINAAMKHCLLTVAANFGVFIMKVHLQPVLPKAFGTLVWSISGRMLMATTKDLLMTAVYLGGTGEVEN